MSYIRSTASATTWAMGRRATLPPLISMAPRRSIAVRSRRCASCGCLECRLPGASVPGAIQDAADEFFGVDSTELGDDNVGPGGKQRRPRRRRQHRNRQHAGPLGRLDTVHGVLNDAAAYRLNAE